METESKAKKQHTAHAAKAAHASEHKEKENKLQFWPTISAALAILLLISVFWNSNVSSNAGGVSKSLDKQQFALDMKSFIEETNPSLAGKVAIENITEENGLYKFSVLLDGKPVAVSYATKDGATLFPQSINVEAAKEQINEAAAKEQEAPKPAKSDVPKVQMFVMSQCPYGVQAENAIKPVLDTLKNKISFELKFIANRNADGTFSSLHGKPEVDENLRQVCAMNVYPNYMDYVICRNANIKSSDWQTCATKSSMNAELIKSCAESREGEDLLAKNIKAANDIGVGSSPTIMINAQDYRGSRAPEGLLTAICAAFNNAPAECSRALGTNLTAVDEAPHTGCGA